MASRCSKFYFLIILPPLLFFGCLFFQPSLSEIKREVLLQVASSEAFKQVEPMLLRLKPGEPIDATGLTWQVGNISRNGGSAGLVSYSNGWIECMSGGVNQAYEKFGSFYGRYRQTAYGMHVFGYVSDDLNIVPKYLVKTQATIILPSEYERLKKEGTPNMGITPTPGRHTPTYLKNIKVKEVQALDYPDRAPVSAGAFIDIDQYIEDYLTPEKFREAEDGLNRLKKGTELMQVVKKLDGVFVMKPSAEDFTVFGMKGFLNLTDEYRAWSTSGPDGVFTVWGFGYVEDGKEVPELALVFRNAEVFKVVPYETRRELEARLREL